MASKPYGLRAGPPKPLSTKSAESAPARRARASSGRKPQPTAAQTRPRPAQRQRRAPSAKPSAGGLAPHGCHRPAPRGRSAFHHALEHRPAVGGLALRAARTKRSVAPPVCRLKSQIGSAADARSRAARAARRGASAGRARAPAGSAPPRRGTRPRAGASTAPARRRCRTPAPSRASRWRGARPGQPNGAQRRQRSEQDDLGVGRPRLERQHQHVERAAAPPAPPRTRRRVGRRPRGPAASSCRSAE